MWYRLAPGKRYSGDTKVTDLLYACYDKAAAGADFTGILNEIKERFYEIIKGLKLDFFSGGRIPSDRSRFQGTGRYRIRCIPRRVS